MNILVIGCGQIGSRHIQSLANAKFGVLIYALDKSDESLRKARLLFEQVKCRHKNTKLIVIRRLVEILVEIDVAIIASNSRERAALVSALLDKVVPKHIILEKVLFSRMTDYTKFEKIFDSVNTKVWVNQYMGYEFSFLSKYFKSGENFHMKVSGNWGLCCNSVHFIEIFHHLCGRLTLKLVSSAFASEYKKSKRDGYLELSGSIEICSSAKHRLTLDCDFQSDETVIDIEICSENKKLMDVWANEYHTCTFTDRLSSSTRRYYSRRQSERTLDLVVSLRDRGECNLPNYQQSSGHHLLVLEQFKEKFLALGLDISQDIPVS